MNQWVSCVCVSVLIFLFEGVACLQGSPANSTEDIESVLSVPAPLFHVKETVEDHVPLSALEVLPPEIFERIWSHLSLKDVCSLRLTSISLKNAMGDLSSEKTKIRFLNQEVLKLNLLDKKFDLGGLVLMRPSSFVLENVKKTVFRYLPFENPCGLTIAQRMENSRDVLALVSHMKNLTHIMIEGPPHICSGVLEKLPAAQKMCVLRVRHRLSDHEFKNEMYIGDLNILVSQLVEKFSGLGGQFSLFLPSYIPDNLRATLQEKFKRVFLGGVSR